MKPDPSSSRFPASRSKASVRNNISQSSESILNRGRPNRGISTSFSSNLGRNSSPPEETACHEPAPAGNTTPSVKAIVAWIEKSSETESIETDSSVKSLKEPSASNGLPQAHSSIDTSSSHSMNSLSGLQQSHSSLSFPSYGEDDSLAVLKYRQYFTRSPLARCLEKHSPITESSEFSEDGFPVYRKDSATTWESESVEEQDNGIQDVAVPRIHDTDEDTTAHSLAEEHSSKNQENTMLVYKRNPNEVMDFWNHVRYCLWIPDEEIG